MGLHSNSFHIISAILVNYFSCDASVKYKSLHFKKLWHFGRNYGCHGNLNKGVTSNVYDKERQIKLSVPVHLSDAEQM